MNPGHPERAPGAGSETGIDVGSQDLRDLSIRDLIALLGRTEDQARQIRHDTLPSPATKQLLRYQHAILAELRRRTSLDPTP